MHVFRWDLDRTYLDTEIHSVRGLIRTAFEDAATKRTLPGAAALMRGLADHDPASSVFILSGSPTQMRAVLEEKLALDGVRYDQLVLKDNLGNLRRGRLKALRGQVGYKLPQLLEARTSAGPDVRETLFGDDSEADAVIYAAYAASIAGELDARSLKRVLKAGQAYPDMIRMAVGALERVEPCPAVEDIFIRVDRGVPLRTFTLLAGRVIPVFSWFQAGLVLHARGRLGLAGVVAVARACADEAGHSEHSLAGLLQDAVRRHLVDLDTARSVVDAPGLEPIRDSAHLALDALGPPRPRPEPAGKPDYVGFLRAVADR